MSAVQAPVGLRIRIGEHDGAAQMFLSGELDMATAPLLEDNLAAAQRDHGTVVVDLAGLTFIDSSGIQVLLDAAERAGAGGCPFGIVNSRACVRRMFELTGKEFLLGRHGCG